MLEVFGFSLGTPIQGGILVTLLAIFGLAVRVWITGIPERTRAKNEAVSLNAQIEAGLRGEAAARFHELREDVHSLRNQLAVSEAEKRRCDNAKSTLEFVVNILLSRMRLNDPTSETIKQAEKLLVDIHRAEPPEAGKSSERKTAEKAVGATQDTVNEIKASEAKKNGE